MKKNKNRIGIIILFLISFTTSALSQETGPIPDKVYIDVRMNEGIGVMDTANGRTDVFFYGITGAQYKALPADAKAKLDFYTVPSGTWSILINPIPNEPPYTSKKGEKTYFNPLAIQKVRYALNWLINRKYIVNEILGGEGAPMFTPMTPGQPGTYRYNLIAFKLGMRPEGNEIMAIKDINEAITEASELPENKGKLVKNEEFWSYDGEPVTIKFLIRVDDPEGRLREGRYIGDQIEKAGIKVERLEWDRSKCMKTVQSCNPANLDWHIYTESWGAGSTRAYWDITIAQMLSPWYGYMPGNGEPNFWNYKNEELDTLSKKIFNGKFLNEDEYWESNLRATEIGLKDSVRIHIAMQQQYYPVNKERFNSRMIYGVGDGLNSWSFITADVKPENGQKILRVTQFSAKGALFMSAWDPVGVNGFSDSYTRIISDPICEMTAFQSPTSGLFTPWMAEWKDVDSKVIKEKDKQGNEILVGQIPISPNAVLYDSKTKTWQTVGEGKKAFSVATYTYKFEKWHTGRPIGIADIMYATAFGTEWMNKDDPNDKYYEPTYEKVARPQDIIHGILVNKDGTITTYFDYNFPLSQDDVGASGSLSLRTIPAGVYVCVSWEIVEALAKLVAEGSASKTVYSFSSDQAFTEVDVINPKCVADIRAKLVEMKETKHVPLCIKDYITENDAVLSYEAAIAFIDKHKHAFISNGPFILEAFDPNGNFIELVANRDPSYPFTPSHWTNKFKSVRTRIDNVRAPIITRTIGGKVQVNVSEVEYPQDTSRPAQKASVRIILLLPSGEKVYKAEKVAGREGIYEVKIPAQDIKNLKAGSYQMIVESILDQEAPSVETISLLII